MVYVFNTIPNLLEYSESYSVSNGSENFTLFFTSLPLIHINTSTEILDDPKTAANFMYVSNEVVESIIGIELHGASSQTFPKKTYNIEFWDTNEGTSSHNEQLAGLRNDDDWILDALWNEPLRIRSFIANKYWLEIHTPSYSIEEPDAKPGVDVAYAEMFLNGLYNGIYLISEKVDRKLLKIKKHNGTIRGELYKSTHYHGAPAFDNLIDFDNQQRSWNFYDYKYPKESQETNWENVYDYVNFVMHSTDNDFKNNIWNYFDKENAIHFFIFTNFLRARDNSTKNTYLSKYKHGFPYFMVPWDLDMIWGNSWNGNVDEEMDRIMSNLLFDRLIESDRALFLNDLISAWDQLRLNILSLETVENRVDIAYNLLLDNNIYNREYMVYPSHEFNTRAFISYRLSNRLQFMDAYFNDLRAVISVQDDIISTFKVYPNPVNNLLQTSLSEDVPYLIYNMNNCLLLNGETKNKKIDLSGLKSGIYILKIKGFIKKIIVK